MTPIPTIGRDDLIQKLRDLETSLGTAEMENLMAQADEVTRKKFIAQREQVTITLGKLDNALLADIANQLDQLAPQLNAGITNMQQALAAINNAIAIVNTVSTVLSLAARVVAVV